LVQVHFDFTTLFRLVYTEYSARVLEDKRVK